MLTNQQRDQMRARAAAERDEAIREAMQAANAKYATRMEMLAWFDEAPSNAAIVEPKPFPAKPPPAIVGKLRKRGTQTGIGVTAAVRDYLSAAPETFTFDDVIAAAAQVGISGDRPTFQAAMARFVADGVVKRTAQGTIKTPAVYARLK